MKEIFEEEKGISVVIGATLLIGIGVMLWATTYPMYVEQAMKDKEITHTREIKETLIDLQSGVSRLRENDSMTMRMPMGGGTIPLYPSKSPPTHLSVKSKPKDLEIGIEPNPVDRQENIFGENHTPLEKATKEGTSEPEIIQEENVKGEDSYVYEESDPYDYSTGVQNLDEEDMKYENIRGKIKDSKKKPITISGSHPQNYQINITVNYEDDMQSDFADLRFYEDIGREGKLNYWIKDYTSSTSADIYVKRENDSTYDENIWMYYGDGTTTSESDVASTMSFYDDFEDGTWSDKWQDAGGTGGDSRDESGGVLTLSSGYDGTSSIGYSTVKLSEPLDRDRYVVKTRTKMSPANNYNKGTILLKSDINDVSWDGNSAYGTDSYYGWSRNDGYNWDSELRKTTSSSYTTLDSSLWSQGGDSWTTYELWSDGSEVNLLFNGGEEHLSSYNNDYTSFVDISLAHQVGSWASGWAKFDWVYARKYREISTSIGDEENVYGELTVDQYIENVVSHGRLEIGYRNDGNPIKVERTGKTEDRLLFELHNTEGGYDTESAYVEANDLGKVAIRYSNIGDESSFVNIDYVKVISESVGRLEWIHEIDVGDMKPNRNYRLKIRSKMEGSSDDGDFYVEYEDSTGSWDYLGDVGYGDYNELYKTLSQDYSNETLRVRYLKKEDKQYYGDNVLVDFCGVVADSTEGIYGGEVGVNSVNSFYVSQKYIFEMGAVIMEQSDTSSMVSNPPLIYVSEQEDGMIRVQVNYFTIAGDNISVSSGGEKALRLRAVNTYYNSEGSARTSVNISIDSEYDLAWIKYFSEKQEEYYEKGYDTSYQNDVFTFGGYDEGEVDIEYTEKVTELSVKET